MSTRARWTLLILCCAASTFPADSARAAAVGALLGANRCSISGDAPLNTSYGGGTGLIVGAQGEIALTQDIALSIQPMLAQSRTELKSAESEDEGSERTLDLALDYVSIPVVVKFRAAGGRTYFAGGVDVGFLSSASLTGDGVDEDVKSLFHDVNVGALFGFGVVFPVGRPRLTTELRYVQGLVNLSGAEQGLIQELPDRFYSSGLQIMVGILFPLGGR